VAHALGGQGRHDEAIEPMREALERAEAAEGPSATTPIRIRVALAALLTTVGRYEQAADVLRIASAMSSSTLAAGARAEDRAATEARLAHALFHAGRHLEALAAAERSLEAADGGAAPAATRFSALLTQARALAATGDSENALRAIARMERLVSEELDAHQPSASELAAVRIFVARCRAMQEPSSLNDDDPIASAAADQATNDTSTRAAKAATMAPSSAMRRESAMLLATSNDPIRASQGAAALDELVREALTDHGPHHPTTGRLLLHRAEALMTTGDRAAAAACAEQAAVALSRTGTVIPWIAEEARLLAELARDGDTSLNEDQLRRISRLRDAIIEASGPRAVDLARIDRLRAAASPAAASR